MSKAGAHVPRFRLRFQLQEIDLVQGSTLLGRSPDCHVTIEDPLVSRQHARITIAGEQVQLEDLGSRNGSKVNGLTVRGAISLSDGDRLRIGTHEMVFCRVATDRSGPLHRKTGFLLYCASCKLPYAEELPECPNCGCNERFGAEEDTTLTGAGEDSSRWALTLAIDMLDRAVSLKRNVDAERLISRATALFDDRIKAGEKVDQKQLRDLAHVASRFVHGTKDVRWTSWILSTHARHELVPWPDVIANIKWAALSSESAAAVDTIIEQARTRRGDLNDDELAALSVLEVWRERPDKKAGG